MLTSGMAKKSQSELEAELAAVEKKLSAGVSSMAVDNTKTEFDLDSLRLRAKELRSQIKSMRRPRAASVYLGGF